MFAITVVVLTTYRVESLYFKLKPYSRSYGCKAVTVVAQRNKVQLCISSRIYFVFTRKWSLNINDCYRNKTQLSLTNCAKHCANTMAWLTYKHAPSYMRYHAEFSRSALKDVGINTGIAQNLGSAGTLLPWDGRRG